MVKAPDWSWIPAIAVPKIEVERSYTPVLEGDLPLVVMKFISETEGTEYSIKPIDPFGKWFYYERILKVPNLRDFLSQEQVRLSFISFQTKVSTSYSYLTKRVYTGSLKPIYF